jgi:hypothetical protein
MLDKIRFKKLWFALLLFIGCGLWLEGQDLPGVLIFISITLCLAVPTLYGGSDSSRKNWNSIWYAWMCLLVLDVAVALGLQRDIPDQNSEPYITLTPTIKILNSWVPIARDLACCAVPVFLVLIGALLYLLLRGSKSKQDLRIREREIAIQEKDRNLAQREKALKDLQEKD